MSKDNKVKLAEVTVALNTSLTILESLRGKRIVVDNIVKDTRAKIDELSKAEKGKIRTALGTVTIQEAVELAGSLSKSPRGADDALRQRFQRRRNWLLNEMRAQWPAYDIVSERGKIIAEYVGNAEEREAKEIHARLQEFREMGISMASSVKDIMAKLHKTIAPLDSVNDGMPSVAELVEGITGVKPTTQGGQTAGEVVAEETKAA